ncbi:hypothetical protein OC834_004281 [Tilletia horrida]|nr:hypothetical protein OC834_004281 [Tilletia horrida]
MESEDVDKIVAWLAHASSSSSASLDATRARLKASLLASSLEFLNTHLHQLPPPLLALLPLSPEERGRNRTIATRRREYARLHAPEELSGAGSKDRLGGLWARYSEGQSSVLRVEEERERRARRRQREEDVARRRGAETGAGAGTSIGKGKARQEGSSEQLADPVDLVGIAEARHPSLGEYLDGADDPRAAAAEAGPSDHQDGNNDISNIVEEDSDDEDDEEEEAAEFADPVHDEQGRSRAAPSATGDIAISAFERHAVALFVAGTDPTLPRSLYDAVDFDERWDRQEQDSQRDDALSRAGPGRQGRSGSMRGMTDEDAYFLEDDDEDD